MYFSLMLFTNIILQLLIGYLALFLIACLIPIVGKDKIQNVVNSNEQKQAKKEIRKVRKWFYLGWTVLVVIFNLLSKNY